MNICPGFVTVHQWGQGARAYHYAILEDIIPVYVEYSAVISLALMCFGV